MSAVTHLPVPHGARADAAAAVRAHLAVRQITDSELARMIGVTQSQISRRTNKRVAFDIDELGKIAEALGIGVVDLIQMPTSVPGGGTTLYGVGTGIHRTLTGPKSSPHHYKAMPSREVAVGPWIGSRVS